MTRRVLALALAVCAPAAAARAADGPLCGAQERTLFACVAPGHRGELALCASADLAPGRGRLQYRHRRHDGAIDLRFPRDAAGSRGAFLYAHYLRAGIDRWQLRFVVDGTSYVLEEASGARGRVSRAVEVYRNGGWDAGVPDARIACAGPQRPPAGLPRLRGIVPCDADSALNLGGCPAR